MNVSFLKALLQEGVNRPEWQSTELHTYCNLFVAYVAKEFGYTRFSGLLASEMLTLAQLPNSGWKALPEASYAELGAFPLAGRLVLYACEPPPGEEHGHVCVGAPEWDMEWSPKWGMFVPKVASVGRANYYGIKLSMVFKSPPKPFLLEA